MGVEQMLLGCSSEQKAGYVAGLAHGEALRKELVDALAHMLRVYGHPNTTLEQLESPTRYAALSESRKAIAKAEAAVQV